MVIGDDNHRGAAHGVAESGEYELVAERCCELCGSYDGVEQANFGVRMSFLEFVQHFDGHRPPEVVCRWDAFEGHPKDTYGQRRGQAASRDFIANELYGLRWLPLVD